jgi:hypothetical protein
MADAMACVEAERTVAIHVQRVVRKRGLSPQALGAYCRVFSLLDIIGAGRLHQDDLTWALDAVYLSPTEGDVGGVVQAANALAQEEVEDEYGGGGLQGGDAGNVTCDQFLVAMEQADAIIGMANLLGGEGESGGDVAVKRKKVFV